MAGARLSGEDTGEPDTPRKAVPVAVRKEETAGAPELSLAELRRLADTDGLEVVEEVVQSRGRPDPATCVGSGKAEELAATARRAHADLVIADGELSPRQARALEARVGLRVVDRTALVLDIFARHARGSEGRLQVEPARIAYHLPRLRGQGEALPRIRGGRVAEPAGRRDRARARRAHDRVPSVAITGCTNAGKSALLNRLSGARATSEDVLFATPDPTVRRIEVEGVASTVADTVGFVRHLLHRLVDAFSSTLEEVGRADPALHEIGADDVPEPLVLNKVDVAPPDWVTALCRAHPGAHPGARTVSALTGEGVAELRTDPARCPGTREARGTTARQGGTGG
ncbi:HflX GTPase family protein [Saccharothrix sp. Mg75]|uniref:HflX GTPase family protein n=1 Tax=Saccharothrix sp. Mg75 TaxID=3445357 RepID=UPI003EED490E